MSVATTSPPHPHSAFAGANDAPAPASALALTSCAGLLALLTESDHSVVFYALSRLNEAVDVFWPEVSNSLPTIEALFEDDSFPHRKLAALVAARTYYHLGSLDDAVAYALGADDLFDINDPSEFVKTITACSVDRYIALRSGNAPVVEVETLPTFISRLDRVVEQVLQRCLSERQFRQAIGIALEARRTDVITVAIKSGPTPALLRYVLAHCLKFVSDLNFRSEVLKLLVSIVSSLPEPNYFLLSLCLIQLNDAHGCAELLNNLVSRTPRLQLVALQVAFDLEEVAPQQFLKDVIAGINPESPYFLRLKNILSGVVRIQANLEFLCRNNKTDLTILRSTRLMLESRSSLHHSGLTFANALMSAGTTSDLFLRSNLDWLSRASNWSKFSATAAFGVIHKGHLSQSRNILSPYFPKENSAANLTFSEGGSLFAFGLLNAGYAEPLQFLLDHISPDYDPVILHGACLGVTASGIGLASDSVYSKLCDALAMDHAHIADAAGLAAGSLFAGSGNMEVVQDLFSSAKTSQHDRVSRNMSIGAALVMYRREDAALDTINEFMKNHNALIRYGGVYMIAMAYAGTGSNKALERVLHIAVSDVDNDVRRAAVTAIGFIFFNNPAQVPRIVELLTESFNPYVRYGACIALGVSCASTNYRAALKLLQPLQSDSVDFVRQGSFIAQALISVQRNDATAFRSHIAKVISDKRETPLAKFGAILSQGILDASGRNCCISMRSQQGTADMTAVIGMAIFLQYWHWFPLTHFLSLALQPTALIAVDGELRLPKIEFRSNAKPSLFDYPAQIQQFAATEKIEKMTAVLSTSAKVSARAARRRSSLQNANAASATPTGAPGSSQPTPVAGSAPAASSSSHPLSSDQDGTPKQSTPAPVLASAALAKLISTNKSHSVHSSTTGSSPPSGAEAKEPSGPVPMEIEAVNGVPVGAQEVTEPQVMAMEIETNTGTPAASSARPSSSQSDSSKETRSRKKSSSEPSYEIKKNLTRVLPAQQRFISFAGCPYQPVRSFRMSGILVTEHVSASADPSGDLPVSASGAPDNVDFIRLSVNLAAAPVDPATAPPEALYSRNQLSGSRRSVHSAIRLSRNEPLDPRTLGVPVPPSRSNPLPGAPGTVPDVPAPEAFEYEFDDENEGEEEQPGPSSSSNDQQQHKKKDGSPKPPPPSS